MTFPSPSQDLTLSIYLALAQYPILNSQIRARMRSELFQRGIISKSSFEAETREKAIRSQMIEGIQDPIADEPEDVWEKRLSTIRDSLTDFYFAYNLPYELFDSIVRQTLSERGVADTSLVNSFNPELAPQSMLFEQGRAIENMLPEDRASFEARLREIKAVLIRTLISDQLGYVQIAGKWFTIQDLDAIRKRKIGSGKIGGKSAGVLLAARILLEVGDHELKRSLRVPESYFLGADLTYDFMTLNCLTGWLDQKYKSEEQIRREYPTLQRDFLASQLPEDILIQLRSLLTTIGKKPLIVRSSSLLEDNFGTSFAGKYESHFCPNQGSLEENLQALCTAIIRVYASIFNPDALLYRRAKNLIDYDERMAILIQEVQGERYGDYFLPHASGVGYSRNIYRWSPQIRAEAGFLRLVWGLGTHAVDRIGNDYARLVALSHPTLHPESQARATRLYSQKFVDLLDLQQNRFTTREISEIVDAAYPPLRYLAQMDEGGYFSPIRSTTYDLDARNLVFTFDELFTRTPTAKIMSRMLQILEEHYHSPVDTEFTLEVMEKNAKANQVKICILQCRPQSGIKDARVNLPSFLAREDILLRTPRLAPEGAVQNIRYVVYIQPEGYFALPSAADRSRLTRSISSLNAALANEVFICVGPGRWGTSTPDLGIPVGYGDIYHTRSLIEVTGAGIGSTPEASYGTHFFQDLLESQIFPLAIYLDDPDAIFDETFFDQSPNRIDRYLPGDPIIPDCLRLIDIQDYRSAHHLNLIMDPEKGQAVIYICQKDE